MVGNPGGGKSTIGNAATQSHAFAAGKGGRGGAGRTTTTKTVVWYNESAEHLIVDTPGLLDAKAQQEAKQQIQKALTHGGKYVLVFVAAIHCGRISIVDAHTIKRVLDAVPSNVPYYLVLNQVDAEDQDELQDLVETFRNLVQRTPEDVLGVPKFKVLANHKNPSQAQAIPPELVETVQQFFRKIIPTGVPIRSDEVITIRDAPSGEDLELLQQQLEKYKEVLEQHRAEAAQRESDRLAAELKRKQDQEALQAEMKRQAEEFAAEKLKEKQARDEKIAALEKQLEQAKTDTQQERINVLKQLDLLKTEVKGMKTDAKEQKLKQQRWDAAISTRLVWIGMPSSNTIGKGEQKEYDIQEVPDVHSAWGKVKYHSPCSRAFSCKITNAGQMIEVLEPENTDPKCGHWFLWCRERDQQLKTALSNWSGASPRPMAPDFELVST
jgi:GTP-binding protein EngB required for normal cell division